MTVTTLTAAGACLLILCLFQIITITHALRYSRHHDSTTHHAGLFVNAEPPPRRKDDVTNATDLSHVDEWSILFYENSFQLKTLNMNDIIKTQIKYLVGNDRDIRISVLNKDCKTELDNPSSFVTTSYATTPMGVGKISNLTVSIDFDRVKIESSPLWKNVTSMVSSVELCLLVELHTEAFDDSLATSATPVSFQVPRFPTEPIDDSSTPIQSTIDLSIVSCLCQKDDDECLPPPVTILQHDKFHICIRTNASHAVIRHVDYLMLMHNSIPKGFPISSRNGPDIFTKIETRSDGKIVISSPIPVHVFKEQEEEEDGDGVVIAAGAVIVEWDDLGGRRRLKERVVQDGGGFNDIIDWRANRGVGEVKEFQLDMLVGPYVPEDNEEVDDDEYTRSGIPLLRLLNYGSVMIVLFGFVAANK